MIAGSSIVRVIGRSKKKVAAWMQPPGYPAVGAGRKGRAPGISERCGSLDVHPPGETIASRNRFLFFWFSSCFFLRFV
jgi:hypothetical protein